MNRWTAILILIVATAATFGRAVRFDFTSWDDPDTVAANPRLDPPSLAGTLHYWRHSAGGLYIPVTYTWWSALASVARDEETGRLAPQVFHAGNLLLHMASAVLVFLILRRLFTSDAAACIGALLFALHPLQVEAVAWVSGAKDLLAGLLSLAMIDQLLRFDSSPPPRRHAHYVLALLAFTLAILAKPSAVVAPVIGGILISARSRRTVRHILRILWPMLLLAAACAVWSRAAQEQYAPTSTPLWSRPLIAGDAIAFYLRKLFWPAQLTILHGRTPARVLNSGAAYITWLAPAILIALAILARRRFPWLLAGAAAFVVGLLPVLGFARFMFQIHSTVADHYLYLPMLGVAIAASSLTSGRERWPVLAAWGLVLLVLAGASFRQLDHWRDSRTLFARAVRVNPTSATAHGGLARALAEEGRFDEAIEHFRTVVELSPTSRLAHTNLAQAYLLAGKLDDAIAHAQEALRFAGGADDTRWEHYILGHAYMLSGRYDLAAPHFAERLRQAPQDPAAREDLRRAVELQQNAPPASTQP